ncbi:MAG: hypothetical protein QNI98_05160 [Woeseiaceae bacterium]|nr:hypothetical protein [Woeseiaceae bacterium]
MQRTLVSILILHFALANVSVAAAENVLGQAAVPHMPESVRTSVSRIIILPTDGLSSESVKGTYDRKTDGVLGGMAKGAGMGTIPVEVGPVPIGIPIPILRELGMIAGAIAGGTDRKLQEFRDSLTEDLRDAVDQPLTNDALANDVYWGLRRVGELQPKLFAVTTPIPEDTEALLYVAITDLSINVQKNEAIISTTALARLERFRDGSTLYRSEITYQDRDTLSNWTKNNAILWREYRNFARHYIGREISSALFERIDVSHDIAPDKSASIKANKKNIWQGKTKTRTPTLVWSSDLNDPAIDPANITWDIEIYDRQRPIYSASRIRGTSHTPNVPLESCGDLYWTVRPTYTVDGKSKVGRWMRQSPDGGVSNGNVGRSISTSHAYVQDFALLQVSCR